MEPALSSTSLLTIEGYTPDELLVLPDEQIAAWIFAGGPVVFRIGSAEVLGEFAVRAGRLIVELAQIEGGGDGVLPTLWLLAGRYAAGRGLQEVEWIVHAVHCAQPNLKLRRVLERRGFTLEELPGYGEVYHCLAVTEHRAAEAGGNEGTKSACAD